MSTETEGLKTDLYQLTMAQVYWMNSMSEKTSSFNLYFRKCPFKGNYAISAGLSSVIGFIKNFNFDLDDISWLREQVGNDGKPLFKEGFLTYLYGMKFSCSIDAVEEGNVVFANQPLIKVEGPIIQCQLIETILLHYVNFETLIATKAARIVAESNGEPVIELGYRRAQNPNLATRSAYIGGCVASSNCDAGKRFGIPIKGTMAHSIIMSFPDELTAFRVYAKASANNCIYLVDTYDTIQGIKNAIIVALEMRLEGHEMIGIRLDSGDMVELSKQARVMLDEAGFPDAKIVASNDLDEYSMKRMKDEGAKIDVWGIGTKLVTAYDQPALGGVYKISAMENDDMLFDYKMKLGSPMKESFPGLLQVKRVFKGACHVGDYIYDLTVRTEGKRFKDPANGNLIKPYDNKYDIYTFKNMLTKIYDIGELVYDEPSIHDVRERCLDEVSKFDFTNEKYDGLVLLEENYKKTRAEVKESGGSRNWSSNQTL
jgi:nicotinate phosphoribosyltransferase